ncbi:MAG: MMPL family transporter, partial [Wenzhouxiangellaceae bacterium]|nr:MMPL family transporter [Wenzhouxiangellaceae bacterium]
MADGATQPHLVEDWLTRVARHPWLVLAVCVVLAAAALVAAARLLGVDSDPIAMLDEDLPFRQADERLRAEFPDFDSTLLAVIEAPTPEQASLAARRVQARAAEMPQVERVRWAPDSEFFARQGLMFLSLDELETLSERLVEAQPLLGRLARETSAATLFGLLAQIEESDRAAEVGFDVDAVHARVAEAVSGTLDGRPVVLSWQRLLGAGDADGGASGDGKAAGSAREILQITPVLDHTRVLAARAVMDAMDELRRELGLDAGPVRLYFTGSTALRHEEMESVISGAGLTGLLALALVTAVMLIGLRSPALSAIALVNLALGLALTVGFAALAVGRVNLISVSFVVLYIGLGVNYAVHYLLRYREIIMHDAPGETSAARAAIGAGRFLVHPLVLSAVTTALGFFAFVPTSFSGVAQLGLIAGVAMVITLALSYTALPAMLVLVQPRVPPARPDFTAGWRRTLEWPLAHRRLVIVAGGVFVAAALPATLGLRFDADPLNVRDPDAESVVMIRELLAEREGGYRNIQVLVEPDRPVEPLRRELEALPTVARAVSLESLVPEDQDEKLELIDELAWVLGLDIVEADWQTEPVEPAALSEAARELADALEGTAGPGARRLRSELSRLVGRLDETADPAALAAAVNRALTAGLAPTLGRFAAGVRGAELVTRERFPDWFTAQWHSASGTRLIQVFPDVDVLDFDRQREFTEQVMGVAPGHATGGPVIQLAAGRAITSAFRQALVWAVLGIVTVLLVTLRDPLAAAKVMAPLVLGGLLTVALMVVAGIPLNFANVVALPLLLGVAVDNGIHLVSRHRAGLLPDGNVLKTATARAIVVGAMITAGGFGNLAFSPHSGTASLGIILAMGLALMVVATLVFLPAMLG